MTEIIKLLTDLFGKYLGDPLPGWIALVGAFAVIGWRVLKFLPKLATALEDAYKAVHERIWPLFYNRFHQQAAEERRRFAKELVQRLANLNTQEDFSDEEFTELEADVEVKGIGYQRSWRWLFGFGRQPRRVLSLSTALRDCRARHILLEGEPGSGKSTAVRHLALVLAQRAMLARGLNSILPVYVNLRDFRSKGTEVTAEDLKQHVIAKLIGASETGDVNENTKAYVERIFDDDLKSGRWLFLFDSFDETPIVLRSANYGPEVQKHGTAIERFLEMSGCTGIVASRPYRAPSQFGWTHFQILPLAEARRAELINRSGLERDRHQKLLQWLKSDASPSLVEMTDNPMFLRLLCRYWEKATEPPSSTFEIYDAYFLRRFDRESEKISARGISKEFARDTAELVAYCLSADRTLGLSCSVDRIKTAVRELVSKLPPHFDERIWALRDANILRPVSEAGPEAVRFEHRRFQEYFATGYLLKAPDAVPPVTLLSDPSWREAAVVLLQRRVRNSVPRILAVAHEILAEAQRVQFSTVPGSGKEAWPGTSFHVLKLLVDGRGLRSSEASEPLKTIVGKLIEVVWRNGDHDERQSAIELMSLSPTSDLGPWLAEVFAPNGSRWFQETAVRQFPKLDVDAETKQRYLQFVIGQSTLDSRLGELRYLLDRVIVTVPGRALLHRLVVLLTHQREYYATIFACFWLALALVLCLVPNDLIRPTQYVWTGGVPGEGELVELRMGANTGWAFWVAGLVMGALGLMTFSHRLTLLYGADTTKDLVENEKDKKKKDETIEEGKEAEKKNDGLMTIDIFPPISKILVFIAIGFLLLLLLCMPLFFDLLWSSRIDTSNLVMKWFSTISILLLFCLSLFLCGPISIFLGNLLFLPSDLLRALREGDEGLGEITESTLFQQILFFADRFDPWRLRSFRLRTLLGFFLRPKFILSMVIIQALMISCMKPVMEVRAVKYTMNTVGVIYGLIVAALILYSVGFPLVQHALILWFRIVWLCTVPGRRGSLRAARLLSLLESCRLKTAGRTLLDRVGFTQSLEATGEAIELLTTLMRACSPDKSIPIGSDPPVTTGSPFREFAVRVFTFTSNRRDWLVSLGPDFQDQLAQILVKVKAFSVPGG